MGRHLLTSFLWDHLNTEISFLCNIRPKTPNPPLEGETPSSRDTTFAERLEGTLALHKTSDKVPLPFFVPNFNHKVLLSRGRKGQRPLQSSIVIVVRSRPPEFLPLGIRSAARRGRGLYETQVLSCLLLVVWFKIKSETNVFDIEPSGCFTGQGNDSMI